MLEELGLDAQAEAIYGLMLECHEMGVADIARHMKIPEAEVRCALDRLAALALLRRSREVPGQFRAVSPDVGLHTLLRQQELELLERQERFAKNQTAISRIVTEYTRGHLGHVSEDSERLIGLDSVESRLEELSQRAARECLSLMPGGAQSARSLESSRPLDESMIGRGLPVWTVYLTSMRNDQATMEYARWLVDLGGEVRTAPTLPLRMVLFDRKVALLPIDPDDTARGAVQLTGSGVITALTSLFHEVWRQATSVGFAPKRDSATLSEDERELLRLLAQGLTDEVAARRLGVSLRTVRRMMSSIMGRLGARSRFEAGLRASEHHLLQD